MKIAITGARGTVGRAVVKLCAEEGHSTVQINRSEQEHDGTQNSEMRIADVATDYKASVKAFQGCDALMHLAAVPNPVDKAEDYVHQNNVCSAFNIIAPNTTLDNTTSEELANKYYPKTEPKGDWSTNRAFWTSDKAEKVLGWSHHEKE